MTAARAAGRRLAFVTNNASRTPNQVVLHLLGVGIAAEEAEVLTSAQAGARALARLVPPGSPVLVVGGDGLTAAVVAEGLRPVGSAADGPVGVVQGWFPGLVWPVLAEGAYALATGVPWVATNVDLTLPTSRGVAPGNGSFVAAARRGERPGARRRGREARSADAARGGRRRRPAAPSSWATGWTPTSPARSPPSWTACSCSPG